MAKSLRAKSTIKAKAFRRHNLEYQTAVDSRVLRISEKLKQNYINEKVKKYLAENAELSTVDDDLLAQFKAEAETLNAGKKETGAASSDSTAVEDDASKVAEVSTSGWRDARHLNYRKAKKMKKTKKRGSFTKF